MPSYSNIFRQCGEYHGNPALEGFLLVWWVLVRLTTVAPSKKVERWYDQSALRVLHRVFSCVDSQCRDDRCNERRHHVDGQRHVRDHALLQFRREDLLRQVLRKQAELRQISAMQYVGLRGGALHDFVGCVAVCFSHGWRIGSPSAATEYLKVQLL